MAAYSVKHVFTYTLIFGESKMLSDACRFEELEAPLVGVKPAERGPPVGRVSTEEKTMALTHTYVHHSIFTLASQQIIDGMRHDGVFPGSCFTLIHAKPHGLEDDI